MSDPWQIRDTTIKQFVIDTKETNGEIQESCFGFESNFYTNITESKLKNTLNNLDNCNNSSHYYPLPDSSSYLETLQRKLQRLKKNCKLVVALGEKRQQSLRALLQTKQQIASSFHNNALLDNNALLNLPIPTIESAVQGIYRHFQPVHGLCVGEVVHIIKYDQLEQIQEQSKDCGCIYSEEEESY